MEPALPAGTKLMQLCLAQLGITLPDESSVNDFEKEEIVSLNTINFSDMKSIPEYTKLTVFGYIRRDSYKYKMNNISNEVSHIIILFYRTMEQFIVCGYNMIYNDKTRKLKYKDGNRYSYIVGYPSYNPWRTAYGSIDIDFKSKRKMIYKWKFKLISKYVSFCGAIIGITDCNRSLLSVCFSNEHQIGPEDKHSYHAIWYKMDKSFYLTSSNNDTSDKESQFIFPEYQRVITIVVHTKYKTLQFMDETNENKFEQHLEDVNHENIYNLAVSIPYPSNSVQLLQFEQIQYKKN